MNRETSLRLAREIDNTTHCHSGFPEAKSHGQSFSHEDIGIMTTHESPLQLIQLPRIEIGSRSTTFLTSASICIIGFCNSRVVHKMWFLKWHRTKIPTNLLYCPSIKMAYFRTLRACGVLASEFMFQLNHLFGSPYNSSLLSKSRIDC